MLRMGKETNGRRVERRRGEVIPWCVKPTKADCFLRLGVIDAEEKRYNICIPKGRGERRGWSAMAEVVRELIASFDKKDNKKEEMTLGKLQVEMGKRRGNRDRHLVRVEVKGEEISRNLSRLGHCLIGR